jgi:hypothetical protein
LFKIKIKKYFERGMDRYQIKITTFVIVFYFAYPFTFQMAVKEKDRKITNK